jgi:hypothetical protein
MDAEPGRPAFSFAEQADRIDRFLGGTKGRPLAHAVLSAEDRSAFAQHARNLRAAEPDRLSDLSDVDKLVARISGRDGGVPVSPAETVDLLLGRAGSDKGESIALIGRLKETLGAGSREFLGLKQALLDRTLSGNGSKALSNAEKADRLGALLRGKLAENAYTPNDRRGIEALASSLRGSDPVPLSSLDSVEKVVARISGRDGGLPASGEEVARYLFSPSAAKKESIPVLLVHRLKRALSPESFEKLQGGMWEFLTKAPEGHTPFTNAAVAKRVNKFFTGDGKRIAQSLYPEAVQAEAIRFAEAVRAHAPIPGTTNPSGTAPMLAKMAGKASHLALPLFGAAHGGLVGAIGGVAVDKALTSATNARAARQTAKLYYGQQPKVPRAPIDPRFAKAGMLLGRGILQGQVGNR